MDFPSTFEFSPCFWFPNLLSQVIFYWKRPYFRKPSLSYTSRIRYILRIKHVPKWHWLLWNLNMFLHLSCWISASWNKEWLQHLLNQDPYIIFWLLVKHFLGLCCSSWSFTCSLLLALLSLLSCKRIYTYIIPELILLSNRRCGAQLGKTQYFHLFENFCIRRYIYFQI